MEDSNFIAKNPLEEKLLAAQCGQLPLHELISHLMQADVYVPSDSNMEASGDAFRPLVFDRNGEELMAVFTAIERATRYGDRFPFCLSMIGAKLVNWMPRHYGIVVNPGYRVGMEIPASGVRDIARDFVPPSE